MWMCGCRIYNKRSFTCSALTFHSLHIHHVASLPWAGVMFRGLPLLSAGRLPVQPCRGTQGRSEAGAACSDPFPLVQPIISMCTDSYCPMQWKPNEKLKVLRRFPLSVAKWAQATFLTFYRHQDRQIRGSIHAVGNVDSRLRTFQWLFIKLY